MARQTRAAKEQRCFTMLRSLDLPTDMNDEAEACHQECVRILKDTPLESRDEAMIEFFSRIVRKARTHEALVEHFVSVCSEYDFNVEENCKLETEADQELLAKATKNHKEILSLRKQLANDHCFSIEGTSLADAKRSTLKKAKELFDLGRILHKPQATVQEAILTAVRDRPCQPRRGLVEIQKSWEGEKTAFSKQPQAGGQEDALSCTAPSWASTADEFSSIDHTTHPPINGTTTEGRGGGSVKRQGPESAVSNTSKRFKGDHAKRDPETTTINNGQDNNSAVGAMGNSQADSSPSIEKGRGYASSNGPNLSEEDISFPALNEFEEGVSDTSFEISCNTPGITAKARVCMPDLAPTGRRGPSEPTDSTVKICKHTSDIIDVDSARLGLSDDINDPDIDMLVSGLGLQHDEVALASSYCRSALSSLQPEARLTDAAINLLIGSEVYGRFKIEVLDQIEMKSQIESPSPSRRVSVDLKGAHHLLLPYCCMDHWILVCMESDRENAGRYTLSFYDSLKDRNQDLAKSGSKLLKDYLILMNAIPKDVKLQPQQKDYKSLQTQSNDYDCGVFVVASATSYIDNESTHGLQTIKLRATYQEMIISLKGKERFDLTLTDGSDSLDRMTATIKDLTGLPNPLQGLYNQRKEAMEEKRKLWKECCEGIAALREKKTRAEKTLVEVERSKSYWSTLDNVIVECYGMERDVPSNHGIEERASKLRSTTTELQKDLEGLQTTALQRQKELQLEIQAKRHTAKELWTNIDRYVTGEQDFYEKIKTKFGAHIRDWCNGLSAWCEQDSE